jgi:hypothetical protein
LASERQIEIQKAKEQKKMEKATFAHYWKRNYYGMLCRVNVKRQCPDMALYLQNWQMRRQGK